jgi:4-azaleucine resistance transporter AzlC
MVIAGVRAGVPIFLGYFPVAVSFGLLAAGAGLTLLEAVAFSGIVFAGASQFMALLLLQSGASMGSIVGATLLVNLRHVLMSASVAARLTRRARIPLVAFGVTDETFAVAAGHQEAHDPNFVLALEATAYAGWVLGTLAGHLFGAILPPVLQTSFGFGLYALFVILLIGPIKRNAWNLVVVITAALAHIGLSAVAWPAAGLRVVIAITIGAAVGALLPSAEEAAP